MEQRNLFNQGEILHMKDVKKLVMLVHRVQELTMVYMAFYVALALLITKGRSADVVLGRVMKGSLVTVAIFVLAGLASLVGFDQPGGGGFGIGSRKGNDHLPNPRVFEKGP